jgi:hypothetical protein
MMFVMMPLVATMGYMAVFYRCTVLSKAAPEDLTSAEEFELKIRFVLESHIQSLSKSDRSDDASEHNRDQPSLDGTKFLLFSVKFRIILNFCHAVVPQKLSNCTPSGAPDSPRPPCFCRARSFAFTFNRITKLPVCPI